MTYKEAKREWHKMLLKCETGSAFGAWLGIYPSPRIYWEENKKWEKLSDEEKKEKMKPLIEIYKKYKEVQSE